MDGDDGMQCARHPLRGRANPAGGICALCLQEKLGRLVSGAAAARPYSTHSPPSPPSAWSIRPTVVEAVAAGYREDLRSSLPASGCQRAPARARSRVAMIPLFFLHSTQRKRKAKPAEIRTSSARSHNRAGVLAISAAAVTSSGVGSSSRGGIPVLKRSKSVAPETSMLHGRRKKKSFWSFLQLSSSAISDEKDRTPEEPDDSPESGSQGSVSSFGRRVARSRSVGCGSRSFSGEVLGRISSGFGDCTLRRAESQRESKDGMTIRPKGPAGGQISSADDDGPTPRARMSWAFRALTSPMRAFRASSRHAAIASVSNNGAPAQPGVSCVAGDGGKSAASPSPGLLVVTPP